jgi:hypothetical protein
MNQQGSCATAFRRLALLASIVFVIAAIVSPASAKPGNGNGPPAGHPNGNANGHSNGNANGQSNAGGNPSNNGRRNHGANGRRVRAHGNPTHNASPGNGSSGQHGNNGRRAHGAPSGGSGGGIVKQPAKRGDNGKKGGSKGNNGVPHQKVTLCHATGSDTNPYVEITVSVRAVKAHDRHQNDEDIIPAPAGGCPTGASQESPAAKAEEVLTALGAPLVPTTTPSSETTAAPTGGVADETASSEPRVLGAEGQGGTEPAAAAEPTAGADESDEEESGGSLPFTGLELLIIGAIGVALLLAGIAGRRAFTARA